MNFTSEERWAALRQMYEIHAMPLEFLAIVANLKTSTLENHARRENWATISIESFGPEMITGLVGRLASVTGQHLEQLIETGELEPVVEKQLQNFASLSATYYKILSVQRDIEKESARKGENKAGNEPGNSGEDILALRSDVEAFIDSIGEEEIDPALSAKPE